MNAHSCAECNLLHDSPGPAPTNPEVEIARIQAAEHVAVARLAARAQAEELETTEAVAEIESATAVDVAEIVAPAVEAGTEAALSSDELTEEAPVQQVVTAAPEEETPEAPEPPVAEEHHGSKKKSLWNFG